MANALALSSREAGNSASAVNGFANPGRGSCAAAPLKRDAAQGADPGLLFPTGGTGKETRSPAHARPRAGRAGEAGAR